MKPTNIEFEALKKAASAWALERLEDPCTVVVDTETTGLPSEDPDTEVCQLSVIDYKGRPLFSMLIKPNKPMEEKAISIHGITNEQVSSQPTFPQIAKIVSFVLKDKHIVCYNSGFDVKLLWSLFKKYNQGLPEVKGISCAMEKYSEWKGEWNESKKGLRWHKLPNLSGLPAHDSMSDCSSTLELMKLMAKNTDLMSLSADTISLDFD